MLSFLEGKRMKASVYIHVPFCVKKCAYCDFASYPGRLGMADEYIDRIAEDAQRAREEYGRFTVPTIYIGGGTPSLLTPGQVTRMLDAVRDRFRVEDGAEISMEANPGTVKDLAGYRAAGVNRLSIGVQAAQDRLLKAIGRIHTRADAEEAVAQARAAGFDNVNLDLMYGLPGQTAEDFMQSVCWAAGLEVEHLSLYSLILEEGTPLHKSRVPVPGEDEVLDMQRQAIAYLAEKGYERYEISNYAKRGRECRHNLVYWRRGDYLGLGCAAASLMRGERYAQSRDLEEYMGGLPPERERLTDEDVRMETLMLGLRTREGIDEGLVDKKEAMAMKDFLRIGGGRAVLTRAGTEVMDEVVRRLL